MIVTFEELQALSGYKHRSSVSDWLSENSIPYVLNKHGQPVTTRGALDEALLLKVRPGIGGLENLADAPIFDSEAA